MRSLRILFPRYSHRLILLFIFAVATFLHISNFNGAVYLQPDEERAFNLLKTGPLTYLFSRPFYDIFGTQSAVYYFAGCLGIINILLFYLIGRKLFGRALALSSTLFYAFFPFRINYARFLYPMIIIDFLFLLLILLINMAFLRKKKYIYSLIGFIITLLFYAHGATYSIVFGITLGCLFLFKTYQEKEYREYILAFLFIFLGFIGGILILESLLKVFNRDYSYISNFIDWGKRVRQLVVDKEIFFFLRDIGYKITANPFTVLRALLVGFSLIFFVIYSFSSRHKVFICAVIVFFSGPFLFVVFSLLEVHIIRYRHFVWICPFLSLSLGFCLYYFLTKKNKFVKGMAVVLTIFFISTSIYESYLVTTETFKITPIDEWIKDNNIPKERILTNLVSISFFKKGEDSVFLIPVVYIDSVPHINWLAVYYLYLKKKVDYIIPTGLGMYVYLEDNDIVLKTVRPVKSWVHPYSVVKHRFAFDGLPPKNDFLYAGNKTFYINVYRLDDVFSPSNLGWVLYKKRLMRKNVYK